MADIEKPDPEKHGTAVDSVTESVPHEADASSMPTGYGPIERPPVSTTQADVPIAQSLVAGAGEGDMNVGVPEEEKAAERAVPAEEPAPKKKAE